MIDIMTTQNDFHPVHKPSHYNRKGIEAIQAIEASMSEEQFIGLLKGNVLKYLWRFEYKHAPLEDLHKSKWYLELLIKKYEEKLSAQATETGAQ